VPALPEGIVQLIAVALLTLGEVQVVLPILTVAPLTKPVPVMLSVPPPASAPEVGLIDVTVGGPI
jgi:hypothetical protein